MEVDMTGNAKQHVDALLRRAINNDRDALNELFSRCRGRLYHTLLGLLRNPDDAEEVLQEGLFAAFRNLSTFNGDSQFSTWLTRIVINAALMRLRRRGPEVVTSIDHQRSDRDELPWASRLADPSPNPEEVYARQERLQILEDLLRSLPAPHRTVLWLRDVLGLSTEEAAQTLRLSRGTLKSQLHRARLRLRKEAAAVSRTRIVQRRRCVAVISEHSPAWEFAEEATDPAA